MAYSSNALDDLHRLFRRCVECPPTQPSCPQCKDDETCSLIPPSCDACASTVCVKISSLPGQAPPSNSKPVGAIVGGVIGGVAAVVLIVFVVWFFWIRPRRRGAAVAQPEKRDQSTLSQVGSRTHSIASTVLTRASNVIQIAYIPGITGRSPPESPGIPPPMPNFPHSPESNSMGSTPGVEQHFFMPNDLRSSMWSNASSVDARISLAPSLARASVATTIYRNDAIVPPIPAQHAFRAQANVVRVRHGSGPSSPLPQMPQLPQAPKPVDMKNSSIVARNVVARPIEVKKAGAGTRVPTLANLAKVGVKKSTGADVTGKTAPEKGVPVCYDEKEVAMSPMTIIEDSPSTPSPRTKPSIISMDTASASGASAVVPSDGPLGRETTHRRGNSNGLTAMIEDAIKNASANSPRPDMQRNDSGPFSDANEVK